MPLLSETDNKLQGPVAHNFIIPEADTPPTEAKIDMNFNISMQLSTSHIENCASMF